MIKESTRERDRELRKRFNDMLGSGINREYFNWNTLVEMLAKQPAPRFYISPKMAEQYVLNYKRGVYLNKKPHFQAMIRDLSANYDELKLEYPNAKEYVLWQELIERPAKSFYLTIKTIKRIVYGHIR